MILRGVAPAAARHFFTFCRAFLTCSVNVGGMVPSGKVPICPAIVIIFALPRGKTQTWQNTGLLGGATPGGLNTCGRDLEDVIVEARFGKDKWVNQKLLHP